MTLNMEIPGDLDPACLSLFKAMNQLPGIETINSCCGHGKSKFNVWFMLDTNQIGIYVLSRCLSGRYYNYFPGEQRDDPCWRVYIGDTDAAPCFLLEGKPMSEGSDTYEPAEKLAANIMSHVDEQFALMKILKAREEGKDYR